MPSKKKASQNAFYYYMIDLMAELKRDGYNFPNGLTDVVPIAGPRWKELSFFQKAPYEELARKKKKNKKDSQDSGEDSRLDCTGLLISQRLEPADELNQRFQNQEQEITCRWALQPKDELLNTKFCFVNFQTMCKTLNAEYLPLEVAVVEYSMNEGITEEFHQFINAGEIPVGYRYEAQLHSESTHQIPIENFELAQYDYRALWLKLSAFAEKADFFCLSKDFEEMDFCMNWIRYQSGVVDGDSIKLYALEKLVMDLFKFARHPVAKYQILDMLTTTAFDYEPNTRCTWHEEKGVIHCSLAIIRRFAYAMSDSLTNVYDFKLTACHLPVKDQRVKGVTLNPTQFRFKKSNTFRQNLQRSNPAQPPAQTTTTMTASESYDNDDENSKSEPDMEALRMPFPSSWERRPVMDPYSLSEANFPSLDQRTTSRSDQAAKQQQPSSSSATCWQRPPQDILTSVNSNNHPSEAPRSRQRTRPPQSTSLAAATLNTVSKNPSPSPLPPVAAGGVWSRPQTGPMSQVAPSLENFPTLSSATAESKSGRTSHGHKAPHNNNTTPLCFAAMAGRGRGRGFRREATSKN